MLRQTNGWFWGGWNVCSQTGLGWWHRFSWTEYVERPRWPAESLPWATSFGKKSGWLWLWKRFGQAHCSTVMLQKRSSVSHSTCDRGPYFATSSAASPTLGTQSFDLCWGKTKKNPYPNHCQWWPRRCRNEGGTVASLSSRPVAHWWGETCCSSFLLGSSVWYNHFWSLLCWGIHDITFLIFVNPLLYVDNLFQWGRTRCITVKYEVKKERKNDAYVIHIREALFYMWTS